jgi:L-fuculose-phosphate aldolase
MSGNHELEVANLKEKIDTAIKILEWEISDMMGHVSARTPDPNRFLLRHIRPPIDSRVPEDDVLEFDLTGKRLSGLREAGGSGFEIYFFTGPYNARKNIGGVIHCHPPMALSVVAAGQKVVGITHRHKFDEVPVVPWVYGSLPEHGEIVTRELEKCCAVIIEGHGAVVTGETLEEACVNTLQLERAAKMILLAAPLGKIKPVPREAVAKFETMVEVKQTKSGRPLAEWRYYERLVKRGERWSRI